MYEDHGLTELFIVSDGGGDLNKLSMADALPGVLATVNGQVSMLIVNILAISILFNLPNLSQVSHCRLFSGTSSSSWTSLENTSPTNRPWWRSFGAAGTTTGVNNTTLSQLATLRRTCAPCWSKMPRSACTFLPVAPISVLPMVPMLAARQNWGNLINP